jgi:hypothetical protein
VGVDSTPTRPTLGDDETDGDLGGLPPERFRDLTGQSALTVECAQELADIDDLRLELDDEHSRGLLVPGEEVDDPPLAPFGERDLGTHHPTADAAEPGDHGFCERGVLLVQQAVEVGASGARQQLKPHIQGSRDPAQCPERDFVDRASLNPRYGAARHTGGRGKIRLAPTAADPSSSDHGAEPKRIHADESDGRRSPVDQQNVRSIYLRHNALAVHNPTA